MVWIHGGAFIMGSGGVPMYSGASFAKRHGIVTVTINYRLGLFGFLHVGAGTADIVGLLDQAFALAWVRANIAAFGGDPSNVTVMGESAGSMSIAWLLAMPAARGLFHRAIMESGANVLTPATLTDAAAVAAQVFAELGTDAHGIRSVPADKLLAAQATLLKQRGLSAVAPYIDGSTIPQGAVARGARGRGAESSAADRHQSRRVGAVRHDHARHHEDRARADRRAHGRSGRRGDGQPLPQLGRPRRRCRVSHPRDPARRGVPAPVYLYRFDVASPAFGGRLGAGHAIELPLVWNVLDQPFATMLYGGDIKPFADVGLQLHDTWAAFIKTGVPDGGGLPAWPRYEPERRATMVIDQRASQIVDDVGGEQRKLWVGL